MAIRIRQDAWELSLGSLDAATNEAWHPVLDAYARGVGRMRQRNSEDPLPADSWWWAAHTHGFPADVRRLAPSWGTCEHASPYFLPWHRAYLAWFELTLQGHLGDPDWALPYWDYSGPDPSRLAPPPEFLVAQRSVDGRLEDNPLFVAGRRPVARPYVDVAPAMARTHYVRLSPETGFGGSSVKGVNGQFTVEMQPHNYVHGLIGGAMGAPSTAAQDPIFWLHHANIDRLWLVWRGLDWSRDADDPDGLVGEVAQDWADVRFPFGDPTQPAVYAPDAVLDVETLGYTYDRTALTSEQLAAADELSAPMREGGVMGLDAGASRTGSDGEWTIVGASEQPIRVTDAGAEVEVPVDGRQLGLDAASPAPTGLIVGVEGVEAVSAPRPAYVVEVAVARQGPYHEVGRFSSFGIGDPTQSEPRMFYFDASPRYAELVDDGWTGAPLVVRVSPAQDAISDDETTSDDLDIEQVSLYQRP